MDKIIHILSGPVQSGKTSTVADWSANKKDVFGILTPVINGKRIFMDANSKEKFDMEVNPGEKERLIIGRYTFSKKAFLKAETILRMAVQEKTGWLVVDEIGPLELRGEGFSGILKEVLQSPNTLQNLLLIVRDSILEEVIEHFNLDRHHCVKIDINSGFFKN